MADDIRVKIAAALEAVADPAAQPSDVLDALHALTPARATAIIDLTDPPTPPRYELGDVAASGATIDAAALELGRAMQPRLQEAARATVLPAVLDIADADIPVAEQIAIAVAALDAPIDVTPIAEPMTTDPGPVPIGAPVTAPPARS